MFGCTAILSSSHSYLSVFAQVCVTLDGKQGYLVSMAIETSTLARDLNGQNK